MRKKTDPLKLIIVVTVVLLVLAVLSAFGSNMLYKMRVDNLRDRQQEAMDTNKQRDADYAVALKQFQQEHQQSNTNEAWPEPSTLEGWDVVDLTNYPLELPTTITVSRSEAMLGGLLLVNEWHERPGDFDESSLVSVSGYTRHTMKDSIVRNSSQKLFPVAIDALVAALNDAKEAGLEHYVLQSAYRSWDEQNALFQAELKKHESRYEGQALIDRAKKSVNYPGTSEFNTGLSFSLYVYEKDNAELNKQPFSTSEQGRWMYENSWKYGLIFRFENEDFPLPGTMDKSYKTGVSVELNCYRYVGVPHATVMHHLGLCLEEYIEYLQEHPHVAVFENGILRYEIVRQQISDAAASFEVNVTQKSTNYSVSLDNMGGVVTVFSY